MNIGDLSLVIQYNGVGWCFTKLRIIIVRNLFALCWKLTCMIVILSIDYIILNCTIRCENLSRALFFVLLSFCRPFN